MVAHRRRHRLGRIGADRRFERGLRHRVRPPIGEAEMRGSGMNEDGAAGVGGPQQRIEGPHEAPIRRDVDRHHLVPDRLVDMRDRRQLAQDARIAHEDRACPTARGSPRPTGRGPRSPSSSPARGLRSSPSRGRRRRALPGRPGCGRGRRRARRLRPAPGPPGRFRARRRWRRRRGSREASPWPVSRLPPAWRGGGGRDREVGDVGEGRR